MTERRRTALLAAAAAALTALAYAPAVRFPLLSWDDDVNVAANANLNFRPSGLAWMATGFSLGHWHPITWLTLAFDRLVWGGAPAGYHLTSVLFHALNAALLLLLARRLLAGVEAARRDAAALFAALFWSLHPLRVESVAWISERRDVVCGAFVLASLLAYVRGAEEGDTARGHRLRWAALGLGAAAMASKVFAFVLPPVLLILDARLRGGPRWREKLPWAAPIGLALALGVRAQYDADGAQTLSQFGVRSRLLQAAYSLAFYVRKTVAPSGLGPFYERTPLLEPGPFFWSAVAVAAALLGLWLARRRFPALVHAALAYAVLAFPALGFFKSGRMTGADRYSYLAALPLAVLLGAAFARVPWTRAARVAAASVLACLAVMTGRQLAVWSSDEALWTRGCEVAPYSYFARLKLASAEEAAGKKELAQADRLRAAALHREVFERAAAVYEAHGDAKAAEQARAAALRGLTMVVP